MNFHDKNKKNLKIQDIIFIMSTISCIAVVALTTFLYKTEALNAVLLIPVILTAYWYKQKSVYVAAVISVIKIILDYYSSGTPQISSILITGTFLGISLLIDHMIQAKKSRETLVEDRYKEIFDNFPELLFITQNGEFLAQNNYGEKVTGYTKEELTYINFYDLVHPEDKNKVINYFKNKIEKDSFKNGINIRLIKKDGSIAWVKLNSNKTEINGEAVLINSVTDITGIKSTEEKARKQEKELSVLISQMRSGFILCELAPGENDFTILRTNKSAYEIMNIENNLNNMSFKESFPEFTDLFEKLKVVAKGGAKIHSEMYAPKVKKYIDYYAFTPNANQCAIFITDVTDMKMCEKEVKFLDFHDPLTGLYNNRYLEAELPKYNSLGSEDTAIIVTQLNGIKLANNAFRDLSWNDYLIKFAKILKSECREIDIIVRVDRDKFVIILPHAGKETVEKTVQKIRNRVNEESEKNAIFTAAIGYDIKNDVADDINDIYEQAENNMYRDKLLMSNKVREQNIQTILNALYRISETEQAHANNVSVMSEQLAIAMGLSMYDAQKIKTAALLHDVGNIAIDPEILTKKGKLTDDEIDALRKHAETGYRILSASGVYKYIAKYVLEHHEKWDGTGYPKGLKGEEISLGARIISVVDAYDSMTTEKPYKRALTYDEAISEILEKSGKQFDPQVVEVFVSQLPHLIEGGACKSSS